LRGYLPKHTQRQLDPGPILMRSIFRPT